jgi:hypothetical protein
VAAVSPQSSLLPAIAPSTLSNSSAVAPSGSGIASDTPSTATATPTAAAIAPDEPAPSVAGGGSSSLPLAQPAEEEAKRAHSLTLFVAHFRQLPPLLRIQSFKNPPKGMSVHTELWADAPVLAVCGCVCSHSLLFVLCVLRCSCAAVPPSCRSR